MRSSARASWGEQHDHAREALADAVLQVLLEARPGIGGRDGVEVGERLHREAPVGDLGTRLTSGGSLNHGGRRF